MNKHTTVAALLAVAIVIGLLAITLALNLFVYPFILFSLGNLIWDIPFLHYQLAWIGTKVVIGLLKSII